jgi:hypothetical protein
MGVKVCRDRYARRILTEIETIGRTDHIAGSFLFFFTDVGKHRDIQ